MAKNEIVKPIARATIFYLYCIIALILMCVVISPVNAFLDNPQESYYYSQAFPLTVGPYTTGQADTTCINAGFAGRDPINQYQLQEYDAGANYLTANTKALSVSATTTNANTKIAVVSFTCTGGNSTNHAYYSYATYPTTNFTVTTPFSTSGVIPFTTGFVSNWSTLNGDLVWDFGDGNVTTQTWVSEPLGYTITHTYPNKGTYTVKLTSQMGRTNALTTITRDYYINAVEPDYYCTATPAYIPNTQDYYVYGEVHGTNLSKVISTNWYFKPHSTTGNEPFNQFLEVNSSSHIINYVKSSSNWNGYDTINNSYNNFKGTTMPNPVSLNPIGQSGIIHVGCNIALDDLTTHLNEEHDVLIGGDNASYMAKVKILVQDAYTGYRIQPSTINVQNAGTGIWTNMTTTTGYYNFTYPIGTILNIKSEADGYTDLLYNGVEIDKDKIIWMNMYENATITGGTKLVVSVHTNPSESNGYSQPIKNAQVQIVNPYNTTEFYAGITNSGGTVSFIVFPNQNYSISAAGTQYLTSIKSINTGTINPYQVDLYLSLINIPLTPIVTPIAGDVTPIPTTAQVIQPSGWNSSGAAVCINYNDIPADVTMIARLKIALACWGFTDAQAQSLALAGLIIMIFIIVGGRYSKGLGAAFGGIIGFVLSLGMGLIPFWVFAALLVLTGLAIATIAISKSG